MKTINLPALGQLGFEDLSGFLSWLAASPVTEFSVSQIQKSPPIRTSKVNPMIKVLEQFAMISNKKDRISISPAGREFANAAVARKKTIVRELFLNIEPIHRLQELLKSSVGGRLHKQAIHESFDLGSRNQVQVAEVLAFISWAEACELFQYDKKKEEILLIGSGLPSGPNKDPREPGPNATGLRLVS